MIGPDALRLHIYAVVLAIDAVAVHADDFGCAAAAIQDAQRLRSTSDILPTCP
jgi:hypothetical protein